MLVYGLSCVSVKIWMHLGGGTSFAYLAIDPVTVACRVAWPLNGSGAGVDLASIETSLLLSC